LDNFDRRLFLERTCIGSSLAVLLAAFDHPVWAEVPKNSTLKFPTIKNKYRAAVIGSTGHGDFGHGVDRSLVALPGVEFVAIADDAKSLQVAGKRCRINRLYRDYRQMLRDEQIDLVAIGMRYPDVHEDIVVHCARAGKQLYCEKPLATDLASLDRMAAECDKAGVKLAVALPNRASPAIHRALEMVRDGHIGKLQSLRAQGKADQRGGGEDLMVLGYHMLDLMCLFAGRPRWTFAQVQQGNADATKNDAHSGIEPIGPVAGDCVVAMFGFDNQVHGYFQSHRHAQSVYDRFSLEIYGSAGIIVARNLVDVVYLEAPAFNPAKPQRWEPITTPAWHALDKHDRYNWCHQWLMLDLLSAVEEDREPLSGIHNTRWVQEMIQSVYASHFARARVALPLTQRSQPL
jgi:predicted dehydrogenase